MGPLIDKETFEKWKKEGKIIIIICLSPDGSLAIESALTRKNELKLLYHALSIAGNFDPDEETH